MNFYQSQNRGSQNEYLQYLSAMDAVSIEKVASASVFYDPSPGNILVDVGMASGTSSNILAMLFPGSTVIGVDINPTMVGIAEKTYKLPNLQFRIDDGERLASFHENSIGGFFNCSSIHHITSFNGYDHSRAYNTLKRQAELLKPGGILVVRDFVKPPEMEVFLDLHSTTNRPTPSDAELLLLFSKSARSLSKPSEQGFPVKEIPVEKSGIRRFLLYYSDAVEFIRRKDYFENWEVELQEEYGYFTQQEFEAIFSALGLRIIVSNPLYNPWIIRNRYRGQFTLHNKQMDDIGFPPTNYLIAAEKVLNRGTGIHLVRHLPEANDSFLKYNSYRDRESGKIFDVVERPNSVVDIIPYFIENNQLSILAKHGYPRPLANVKTDSPVIDDKHFSGYITEGITFSVTDQFERIFSERTGLFNESWDKKEKSFEYFTSPGGINEKVESYFIALSEMPVQNNIGRNISGFADSGNFRKFDAVQLLKTAQTGALVEARLELNIYNLLKKKNIPFPQWMGEKIELQELEVYPSSLNDILSTTKNRFDPSSSSASYLQKNRAKFAENEIESSTVILEYVVPQKVSTNTLITLPVIKHNGDVYVGLEIRDLPVPQLLSGNSTILVAPACRLPKTISNFKQLENLLLEMDFYGTRIAGFNRLGEKFFPSIGVTPEQAYPYIVTPESATDRLKWVKLNEFWNCLESIRDGHLLIAIFRLVNSLL